MLSWNQKESSAADKYIAARRFLSRIQRDTYRCSWKEEGGVEWRGVRGILKAFLTPQTFFPFLWEKKATPLSSLIHLTFFHFICPDGVASAAFSPRSTCLDLGRKMHKNASVETSEPNNAERGCPFLFFCSSWGGKCYLRGDTGKHSSKVNIMGYKTVELWHSKRARWQQTCLTIGQQTVCITPIVSTAYLYTIRPVNWNSSL